MAVAFGFVNLTPINKIELTNLTAHTMYNSFIFKIRLHEQVHPFISVALCIS